MTIDEILGGATKHNLACNTNLTIFLKAYRRLLLITVVEDYCDRSFGYARLASLIDEILLSTVDQRILPICKLQCKYLLGCSAL